MFGAINQHPQLVGMTVCWHLTFERYVQLRGKQPAHFGHVVIITVDSVVHLFFTILPFARAVWRMPGYVRHSSGQRGCPGLIWRNENGQKKG